MFFKVYSTLAPSQIVFWLDEGYEPPSTNEKRRRTGGATRLKDKLA